jgi:hypothetical protein
MLAAACLPFTTCANSTVSCAEDRGLRMIDTFIMLRALIAGSSVLAENKLSASKLGARSLQLCEMC